MSGAHQGKHPRENKETYSAQLLLEKTAGEASKIPRPGVNSAQVHSAKFVTSDIDWRPPRQAPAPEQRKSQSEMLLGQTAPSMTPDNLFASTCISDVRSIGVSPLRWILRSRVPIVWFVAPRGLRHARILKVLCRRERIEHGSVFSPRCFWRRQSGAANKSPRESSQPRLDRLVCCTKGLETSEDPEGSVQVGKNTYTAPQPAQHRPLLLYPSTETLKVLTCNSHLYSYLPSRF